jgi:hypothetical protein
VSKTHNATYISHGRNPVEIAHLIARTKVSSQPEDKGVSQNFFLLYGSMEYPKVWAYASYGPMCSVHVQFCEGADDEALSHARQIVEALQALSNPSVGAHLSGGPSERPQFVDRGPVAA